MNDGVESPSKRKKIEEKQILDIMSWPQTIFFHDFDMVSSNCKYQKLWQQSANLKAHQNFKIGNLVLETYISCFFNSVGNCKSHAY